MALPSMLSTPPAQLCFMKEEGLEDLADDVWLAEGSRLPVHSAVVSLRSAVLRDAYRTARDSGWPAQQVSWAAPPCCKQERVKCLLQPATPASAPLDSVACAASSGAHRRRTAAQGSCPPACLRGPACARWRSSCACSTTPRQVSMHCKLPALACSWRVRHPTTDRLRPSACAGCHARQPGGGSC